MAATSSWASQVQLQAINMAGKSKFMILTGGPGTGKTTTTLGIIKLFEAMGAEVSQSVSQAGSPFPRPPSPLSLDKAVLRPTTLLTPPTPALFLALLLWQLALAAPTGRAAKRLEEATGAPAKTLHRLLEYSPDTKSFNKDIVRRKSTLTEVESHRSLTLHLWLACQGNPLSCDVLVVDEASMVDVVLMSKLLESLRPSTTVGPPPPLNTPPPAR